MANNVFIFDFVKESRPSDNLPEWAKKQELYTGKFMHSGNFPTSYVSEGAVKSPTLRSGKLTRGFAKALCRAEMIATGCEKDGFGINSVFSVCEMTLSDLYEGDFVGDGDRCTVVYNRKTGNFHVNCNGEAYPFDKHGTEPFFLAMWPCFLEDSGFKSVFDGFVQSKHNEDKAAFACYMADWVYYKTRERGSGGATFPVCDKSKVMHLTKSSALNSQIAPESCAGTLDLFAVSGGPTLSTGRAMETKEFLGMFAFSENKLTPEQEALVPKLDERYIVTKELLTVCEHIKKTTGMSRPIRNILYRGAPGVGKSESYVGIAAGCHLPLYTFAANALTEPFDLFGQFVPVDENGNETGGKIPLEKILSEVPSFEDIAMDPGLAFQQITGTSNPTASATDCMTALFNLAQKSLNASDGQQRFKFAPGQLIKALRDGGVWGFDEVTLPQNPGVVPALNPAMDATNSITLPTGEVIHRHPDCIIVGTTNIDLEGCHRLNQAWQDRCQLIIDLPEPPDDVLLERIKSMTDWNEEVDGKNIKLDQFLKAYKQLQEIAHKRRAEDGVIGPRKLADWVTSTRITNDPVLSATMTIIPGGSTDPKVIAEFKQKIQDLL